MSRGTLAVDRVAAVVVALAILAAAVGLFFWGSGLFPGGLPSALDLTGAVTVTERPEWPGIVAVAGVILVILSLRWLLGHLPPPRLSHLTLPGSRPDGRLLAAAGTVASVAASVLAEAPGVRSARGSVHRDRGRVIARLSATVEPEADLREVARAVDTISADLQRVLARDDLQCRAQLRLARRARPVSRVR